MSALLSVSCTGSESFTDPCPLQLTSLEHAVSDQQAELQDVLAAHATVHQTQEQAKAELASVEQQLHAQRAARAAQLEQHASQVHQCMNA